MCDSDADPHLVGCKVQQGKLSEILNSSTSISDLSEAASDMSLSTSPGSDIPSQSHKDFIPPSSANVSINAQQPRKRVVVRQLSSNPYLTSSEMSPSDDHPVIVGSHSFAAGDSRLYANGGSFPDNCLSELLSKELSQKANSYPLTSTCFWESDEDEDDNGNDELKNVKHVILDNSYKKSNCDIVSDKVTQIPGQKSYHRDNPLLPPNIHSETHQPVVSPTTFNSVQVLDHPKHYLQDQHLELHEQQYLRHQSHHHFHHQYQQHHDKQSHSTIQPENGGEILPGTNKINGFKRFPNQNELHSGNVTAQFYSNHPQDIASSSPPKSREINSWGHFYKPMAESHYKYRRSHYSSDSEEEEISSNKTEHAKESSTKGSLCKTHKLPCKCSHQDKSDAQSFMHNNNANTKQARSMDKKLVSQNGMKPHEFKERFQLIKKWFSECNDGQKNIVLKGLLHMCELPQLHLLSVHMSKELHHGCPSNCEDIITWLPPALATKVISYLDPVSLCRAAQVCKVWRQLAEDQSLWRRFCCETKWRLSKAAEHKQVISHMSPEGSIQWKNVFAERFRLRNNWLKGRCTVRTFEGHLQGISCVQFDDSRIVSGSSDKTIKVWNMRTNAPWSVQTLMGHHGTVRCLHLEGNRLVSGSCDKTIKVWDLSTQESWSSIACKVTMTGHTDTVRCLQADDDKVISGSYDKSLKIWDLKSGKLRTTLRGHQASVLCVHFSETKIVSGSADKTINVWNYEGQCVMTLRGHQDAVTCLMFDSMRIVSGSLDHNLKFWDIHTGKCLNTIDWKEAEGHTDVIRCLQADSWRVVSAADDKTIKVWNLATGERLVTLRNHTDGVTCLQFNDFIIVSGSYDKSVKLWDFSCC